jgi:hypothetical protein
LIHVTRAARITCFALLALSLAAGISAKAGKRRLHARSQVAEELLPQQHARLGPMRYYGGPKSPMWSSQ